jgi:hypothetical protein
VRKRRTTQSGRLCKMLRGLVLGHSTLPMDRRLIAHRLSSSCAPLQMPCASAIHKNPAVELIEKWATDFFAIDGEQNTSFLGEQA